MTNRERSLKTMQSAFERQLREADDEQLAMIAEDLIDCGYCAPVTSNRLRYFDEIYDFLLKEGDKVEINAEGFKDCEVKNEKVKQNMKNVLEIEKKNAVKEFVEKLKAKAHSVVGFNVRKKVYAKEYTINEIDIDELLKEYEQ